MSDADPTSSLKEAMKRELSRYRSVILEREKMEMELRGERDLLKKEVEELRAKMVESRETALLCKSTLQDLEQKVLKANAALAVPPAMAFSSRGSTTVEYTGRKATYLSGCSQSKHEKLREIPEGRGVTHPLVRCCDLKIVDQIKKNLQKENLERFEQSCFGHFLKINHIQFQGKLLLHLLMHIDMGASSKERLVLRINNSVVEFGPRDFSLITGLRLGAVDANLETFISSASSSSIQKDVFNGNPRIFVENIKTAFLKTSRENEGGGELTFKLAMLYFLHGALLAVHPLQKFDFEYFGLAEDMQKFNEFPWGQVSYEFLVSSLLSARRLMESSSQHRKPTLVMQGFSFALQVWAFEMMPSLAEYCAVRVSNPESITPRILRWSAEARRIRFERLKIFFAMDDKKPLMLDGIQASPAELEKLSSESIHQPKIEETLLLTEKDQSNTHESELVQGTCLPSAPPVAPPDNLIVISDSDSDSDSDEDDEIQKAKRKRSEGTQATGATASIFDSTDSDDDSCSDSFMDNYIASLQSRTATK